MTLQSDRIADFGFSSFVGIGPIRYDKLCARFGSSHEAYLAPEGDIKACIGESIACDFVEFRSHFKSEQVYEEIVKKQICIASRTDDLYPKQLHNIYDRPICIYIKGDIRSLSASGDHLFGIVGTRNPTEYGISVARKFGRELAEAGFTIVSGMAMGIDAQAHWGALEAQGKTIAVLGCGVNVVYPQSNNALYHSILEKNGVIISEFPPDRTVMRGLFVSRNRIIAALSKGILVVEGLKDSGSLVTARCALEQGKEIFAPPAPITSIQSQAPNMLLKEGANLITDIDDILGALGMSTSPKATRDVRATLTPDLARIYDLVCREPYLVDDIARALSLPIQTTLLSISELELAGRIRRTTSGAISAVV